MLLIIDNYDSFTYNLVQYFLELDIEVRVQRNNTITLQQIEQKMPRYLVISPGPGAPDAAGISLAAIQHFAGKIPILGVCLGHQAIAQVFGGKISHAMHVMHGKTSKIYHANKSIFQNIPNAFSATRYHSLTIDKNSLPNCLEITAWTQQENGDIAEIMGIKHHSLPIEGIQFHPESILTEHGLQLLKNFLLQSG